VLRVSKKEIIMSLAGVHPIYAYSPTTAPPPVSCLGMCAPYPHTASAPVWVADICPRAADMGWVWVGFITHDILAVTLTT
jgi:hypothetical protein